MLLDLSSIKNCRALKISQEPFVDRGHGSWKIKTLSLLRTELSSPLSAYSLPMCSRTDVMTYFWLLGTIMSQTRKSVRVFRFLLDCCGDGSLESNENLVWGVMSGMPMISQ